MNKTNKFSPEIRERAVRLVQAQQGEYPSPWVAVESIAPKIGCVSPTRQDWDKREEIDSGQRDGLEQQHARTPQGAGARGQGDRATSTRFSRRPAPTFA